MCGLIGLVDGIVVESRSRMLLRRKSKTVAHYGPDVSGLMAM